MLFTSNYFTISIVITNADLTLEERFPLLGVIVSNSHLISLITNGPITNDIATPSEPHRAATAVEVVRCSRGNQVADSNVGAAWVTGPAKPFNS